ncbi:MAG: alkaline phosphatase [Gemmataceae bacterium]
MMFTRRHFGFTVLATLCDALLSPLTGSRVYARMLAEADGASAGPLVGHTTEASASVWMYTADDAAIEIQYAAAAARDLVRKARIEKVATDDLDVQGQAWKAIMLDLEPGTAYHFDIVKNGEVVEGQGGSFRTAPRPNAPGKFRLGVTSCMRIDKPQESWQLFLKDQPDLHLTLGDTVYANSTDPKVQWRHHLRYRQSPAFARVIRAMPTYALWDDHDYGENNSDATSKGKEASLSGWERIWTNPGMGSEGLPGAFYRFSWGDVEFFVVDGRYHRSPGKQTDDERKTMLGEKQFAWLIDGLKASRARFKIVASGSPLDHSMGDGWRVYTHSRHQFFDAIKTHKIPGVVYVSGSLHNSLVWEHHESQRVGYPMVEVISSGIANSKKLGYATMDFDTTLDDPTMAVRIVHGNGKVAQQKTYRLSQLTHQS